MDDISAMISQVLSDPEKMRQIQSIAASLGLGDSSQEGSAPTPPPASAPSNGGAGVDLSALNDLLGSLGNTAGTAPDTSGLADLLSGLTGGANHSASTQNAQPPGGAGSFDVGGLAGLLRSGNPAGGGAGPTGGFDMGVLLKLQQAMANISTNRSNIELLMALKPRLSEPRAKKIDDAIRVMQVVQFLPLLKETGLFGQMDSILGGLGGVGSALGGLGGGLLGNLGGGLGSLLGNLTGKR